MTAKFCTGKQATVMALFTRKLLLSLIFLTTLGISVSQYSPPAFEYLTHEELEQYLQSVADEYPERTHLYDIGSSVQTRTLWVLAIAAHSPDEHLLLRPEVKYVGNMHGNEIISREILIHLIHHLVSGYGNNANVTDLLDSSRVHIMVTMNPDGYRTARVNYTDDPCSGVVGRHNANDYDLNRNFPDHWFDNPAPLQKETLAVMEWLKSEQFVLSANLHGGALVANYGYDNNAYGAFVYTASPDDDVLIELTKTYSYAHPTMSDGDHCGFTFEDGITNGAEWYPIIGGMQDYNYLWAGCIEITLEVACCKYPEENTIESYWDANKEPLMAFLHKHKLGVKGIVTDDNNNPIKNAKVTILGREDSIIETTEHGEYWRLLLPGEYTLQVSHDDFGTTNTALVIKNRNEPLIMNITLVSDDTSPPNVASAKSFFGSMILLVTTLLLQ